MRISPKYGRFGGKFKFEPFQHCIRTGDGSDVVEYLTKVRMDKAKQLLRTTGTKTTEIAFEVGFRDAHYFSNLFKKTQGCTPREYRNRSDRPEQEQEKL